MLGVPDSDTSCLGSQKKGKQPRLWGAVWGGGLLLSNSRAARWALSFILISKSVRTEEDDEAVEGAPHPGVLKGRSVCAESSQADLREPPAPVSSSFTHRQPPSLSSPWLWGPGLHTHTHTHTPDPEYWSFSLAGSIQQITQGGRWLLPQQNGYLGA